MNEEMQLSAQIMDYELLLDGAFNDRYIPGSQVAKKRITVGLNISVEPCEFGGTQSATKRLLKDHLAEIEIEVVDSSGGSDKPSIITLLPRDRTYNVASLSDKSISIGAGGVLGGVLSIGGNWLWHKQKYYLIEQQDTVAIDESTPQTTKFVWQYRPVLGRDFISAGTKQNFVQFAIPDRATTASCTTLKVRTRWRKIDLDTGIIGPPENAIYQEFKLPNFDLSDPEQLVTVRDIGGGLVDVRIGGSFQEGMSVRVGGATLSSGSPQFSATTSSIEFIAAAKDLVTGDAFLINRDGTLAPVRTHDQSQIAQCGAKPAPASPNYAQRGTVSDLNITPFSDSQSLVRFMFQENQAPPAAGGDPRVNPIVASMGAKVFGLQGASFRSLENKTASGTVGLWSISFLVPNDLLQSSDQLFVQRLFVTEDRGSIAIPLDKFPKSTLAISGIQVVSLATKTTPIYRLLVTGSGLKTAVLSSPKCASIESQEASYMFILMPHGDCNSTSKALVLTSGNAPPVFTALPKLDASAGATPKAPVDPLKGSVAPGDTKAFLSGDGLDEIQSITYGKVRLPGLLSLDKKTLDVPLTPDMTATEGIRYLNITTTDSKHYRYELTIKKP
ncbi:MAG: hypothetical protein WBY53_20510 [Acidobacteriaceae bacterium]